MSAIMEEGIGFGGNASQETSSTDLDSHHHVSTVPAAKDVLDKASTKNIQETKKTIQMFHEKMTSFPKYISYDASMILCVLLSLNKVSKVNMATLPSKDQDQLKTWIPDVYKRYCNEFNVEFDDNKDFKLTFETRSELKANTRFVLNIFNSVIHPRKEDLQDIDAGDVKVENTEKEIVIGGKATFNKKDFLRMAGIENYSEPTKTKESQFVPEVKQSNKNPYEIREDMLTMAFNIIESSTYGEVPLNAEAKTDRILSVASKLYEFVENKRKSR